MRTGVAVGLVLLGYAALATAQDGPLQVWLLILAPFALLAAALVLYIADRRKPRLMDRRTMQ